MKIKSICTLFIVLFSVITASAASLGADTLGLYGACSAKKCAREPESKKIFDEDIGAIFLPANGDLIKENIAAGRKVFITLNAFGGKSGWKMFPDSRPVQADGEFVSSSLGGVCPTHEGWRRSRLELLTSWLAQFGGKSGVSGVWLDFIRYPGRWEERIPEIPDTCYCDRCLLKFQHDTGVVLPHDLLTTSDKSTWLKKNVWLQWMKWKKSQIVSFVREAKNIIDDYSQRRPIQLGVFLVPWKKSDRDGAVSFQLAQDAELLAPLVDVFSPMVYHQMVGKTPQWVGEITDYMTSITGKTVWPIIQAGEVSVNEFAEVVQTVSQSTAKGMLVYKSNHLAEKQWPVLQQFTVLPNVLKNSHLHVFSAGAAVEHPKQQELKGMPEGWHSAPVDRVYDSKFWIEQQDAFAGNAIGLTAGYDRQAVWTSELPECNPGSSFLFSAEFFRSNRSDGHAYPEVSLWGQDYRLNTHRMTGKYQKLKAIVHCPADSHAGTHLFQFKNNYPGNTFWMRLPELKPGDLQSTPNDFSVVKSSFFPIGTYGANVKNLHKIKELGLNTAVIHMNRENIAKCLELDMRCTLGVPRNPEKLIFDLVKFKPLLLQGQFSYYVNDEPGIHSFPEGIAEDLREIIKQYFPCATTHMAIVRPQVVPFYAQSADYFMLDQYPVPSMPLTWLPDSMDEAAGYVGSDRLESVIQAFGGEKYAKGGWLRLPTFAEMNSLAFLSIIHGSRGIYFYTYPAITKTVHGREGFARLIHRLNSMQSWLRVQNIDQNVQIHMRAPYQFDPRGNPAVHCAVKEMYTTQMMICANSLATSTEAEITISPDRQSLWQDYFGSELHRVAGGTLLERFSPFEVKVLLEVR